ncbi:MAG: HEAT repeat domain-containing protein, partial [Myxococcota bacterium]
MTRRALIASLSVFLFAANTSAQDSPNDGPSQSRAYLVKLVDALKNDDSFKVRLQAAVLLGRSGEDSAVDPLIESLNTDEHYTVRAASATALANLDEPKAIPHIIKRMAVDTDDFVREEATRALDKYERDEALPYVVASYDGFETADSVKVRRVAVVYLTDEDVGPEGERVLERALGDKSEVAEVASGYLLSLEDRERALSVLNDAIRDKEPTVRRGAVEVLEQMNTKES